MNPIVEKLRAAAEGFLAPDKPGPGKTSSITTAVLFTEAADEIERLTAPAEGVEYETTEEERAAALYKTTKSQGWIPAELAAGIIRDFDRQAAHIATLNAALAAEKVRADAAEADMRTAIRAANGVASRLETELATSEAAREKAEAALREARDELALAEEVPSFTEEQRRGCIARALVAIRAALKPTGATP